MSDQISVTEEIKDPETFDLGAFITQKVKYPTRSATVVLDRDTIYRARELAEEITDTEDLKRSAALEALAPDLSFDEKLEELKTQLEDVMELAKESSLTFVLRGTAPKVWRAADKALRHKFKAPKNASDEEKYEFEVSRIHAIRVETVFTSTVEVVAPNGSKVKPSRADIEAIADDLDEHEWNKVVELAESLTFEIHNLDDSIGSDSDFLQKS